MLLGKPRSVGSIVGLIYVLLRIQENLSVTCKYTKQDETTGIQIASNVNRQKARSLSDGDDSKTYS